MQQPSDSKPPKKVILHMDDDKNARELLAANLEKYECISTDRRMKVMGALWDRRKDLALVLIDQNMSPEKGSEIIPKIRETLDKLVKLDPASYARRPPVVLCSSEDEAILKVLVASCGADGYLCKGLLSGSTEQFALFYETIDAYVGKGVKKPA